MKSFPGKKLNFYKACTQPLSLLRLDSCTYIETLAVSCPWTILWRKKCEILTCDIINNCIDFPEYYIQGWSIVLASWKDILSDYVANERTLGNLGDDYTVVYNYGFLFAYGIGFGYPLLLSLPEETKSCGRQDFLRTLYEYELQNGVQGLLARGASNSDVVSILTEFETIVATRLNCFSNDENIESQKALNGVKNLIAAMNARSTITTARLANTNNVYYDDHSQQKSFPESFESNEIGSSDATITSSSSSAEYES